jgi:NAD-dependent SIR2 family protein deacetylase
LEVNKELSDLSGFFHVQRQGLATECVTELVEELLAGE